MEKPTWETRSQNSGDSLRSGARQGALRLLRLRCDPTGDSTPPLRLKTLVWLKGSLSARPHGPARSTPPPGRSSRDVPASVRARASARSLLIAGAPFGLVIATPVLTVPFTSANIRPSRTGAEARTPASEMRTPSCRNPKIAVPAGVVEPASTRNPPLSRSRLCRCS